MVNKLLQILRKQVKWDRLAIVLTLVSALLHFLWLNIPNVYVFDELYYIPAAKAIIQGGGQVIYLDNPPLAQLFIVLGLLAFGDNPWGWRIFSAFFGMACTPLVYLLVKKIASSKTAFLSSFLVSFDTMFFNFGRIATLDIFYIFFMLLGFYLYFDGKLLFSGVSLALSSLCKFPGLLGVGIVIVCYLLQKREKVEKMVVKLKNIGYFITAFILVFVLGLWICEPLYGFSNPFEHLQLVFAMLTGASLYRGRAFVRIVVPLRSYPWQWLWNQVPIRMFQFDGYYLGQMNPFILFLTIPSMFLVGLDYWEKRDSLSLFLLTWFIGTYLIYYPLAFVMTTYIHYFLPTIPCISLAISDRILGGLKGKGLKYIPYVYLAFVVGYFLLNLPVKGRLL